MKIRLIRPVFNRDQRYELSSRAIRWVCLGLVIITYPLDVKLSLAVFSLVGATLIYNTLRYSKRLMRSHIFSSRVNLLIIDYVFVLTLVALTGGLSSP